LDRGNSKERLHILGTKVPRVPLAVKHDIALDPTEVLLFGTVAVVLQPDLLADLVV